MMEDATKRVRDYQQQGKNVTRWGMIYNLGYFNLVQSGCFQCKFRDNEHEPYNALEYHDSKYIITNIRSFGLYGFRI